jgi:hypothetical protein
MSIVPLVGFAPNYIEHVAHIYAPTPIKCNMELEYRKIRILYAIMAIECPKTPEQAKHAYWREGALGKLQERPVMVAEVNRILGYNKYVHKDALDSIKAVEIFNIYQSFHNPNWDMQKAAYLWVAGSNYKNATKEQWNRMNRYWRLVSKQIK